MQKLCLISFILISNTLSKPYLFGTSLNTAAVSDAKGITATETTSHSLDDVSQSKSYSHGDKEVNARSDGQTIWVPKL